MPIEMIAGALIGMLAGAVIAFAMGCWVGRRF